MSFVLIADNIVPTKYINLLLMLGSVSTSEPYNKGFAIVLCLQTYTVGAF